MKSKNKNCFNCDKLGHFTRDCTKSKVMFDHNSPSNIYVSSCLMLAETVPFFIVNSIATDHIARDRTSFVKFCQISKWSRCIYMGNNASTTMLGMVPAS